MTQPHSETYLIFADTRTNSNKFWSAIARNNGTLEINWGRVGYSGQTKVYQYNSYDEAISKLQFLTSNKKKKGYKESQPQSRSQEQLQIYRALVLLNRIKPYI